MATAPARQAKIYRMVMPEHTCPYGLKAKDLLRREGYQVDDHWLKTREETDAFKAKHGVKTTPQTFIASERVGGYDDLRRFFGKAVRDPKAVGYAALAGFIIALIDRRDDGGAWAALEILSMVTHGQKAIAPEIVDLAKLAILSPSIADDAEGSASNSDYTYDRMLRLIDTAGGIDGDFVHHFALQVVQACRTTGPRRGRPSDVLRGALAIITQRAPAELWPILASFYEIATRIERERLNAITSATKLFAYDVSRIGAGALFETPLKLMLYWVAIDPDGRIAFLLTFFPILEQKDDEWIWHPALQKLATLYGSSKRFGEALRLRIYPSSWGGSLNPHLTSFKAPLASWINDPALGDWAGTMLENVNRSLERNHNEN